jgi:putative endonuclease
VGATQDELEQRIRRHNAHHKGFTGRANDWALMHAEPFETLRQAQGIAGSVTINGG